MGLQGHGQPLPAPERQFFKTHLDYDLRDVRIHTDATGAALAAALHAEAFTVGTDIVFAAGTCAPQTEAGRWGW